METLSFSIFQFTTMERTVLPKAQVANFKSAHKKPTLPSLLKNKTVELRLSTALSSPVSTEFTDPPEQELGIESQAEKFDWYAHWYPIMPVCDLDKRKPHAKKVMGIDVVVWWDRNESEWKVFDDMCPHRLAPLSEGRIDQWGRLQCVYHGWCFSGSGDCKFIPQAPPDGPPVYTFRKACAAVYPSVVLNNIVWFWPNSDPQYSDIFLKKKPPYIPELDDPSFTSLMGNRDIPYGYDVLIDNLMDPAHVRYAHYGIIRYPRRNNRADREGGEPVEISVEKLDVDGFLGNQSGLKTKFMAPCVFYAFTPPSPASYKEGSSPVPQRRVLLVFYCIPVSPGNSRLIWSFPRNFALWIDQIVPRWIFHVVQNNLVIDSDLYLLHAEERKLMEVGPTNWQKVCFVPTKADAQVVAFRRWFNKYSGGQVDWGPKYSGGALPPTPPREQLMDRYWTHTVNCQSCSAAYNVMNALEVVLQIVSIIFIGMVAACKQGILSAVQRNALISIAVLCFVSSKWLSHFVYKSFRFHDYNHAFR